jgi:alanyl-tRNA synthetase
MQSNEIRRRFLDFFAERDHRIYPSSSLIPYNDPTVLLTTAGMQQFITYFTGEEKPPSPRAVSAQKCMRAGGKDNDIEEVGDRHHLTFFEMMGNFSFGDYFKREAVEFAWEFLTVELGLPPERLWITIFEGDEDAPEDLEAKEFWMSVGVPKEKIFGLPKSENWWGPPGESGPCGPCSEIYYDYGEEYGLGDPLEDPKYGPGGDQGDPRFLEIWNLVFNQYEQRKDGSLVPLAKTGVDTGLGLERTTAVVQGVRYVYDTDLYAPAFEKIEGFTGISIGDSEATDRALRIVADHTRSIAFMIADGVRPGNQRREYVLRRVTRRATLQAYSRLGMTPEHLASQTTWEPSTRSCGRRGTTSSGSCATRRRGSSRSTSPARSFWSPSTRAWRAATSPATSPSRCTTPTASRLRLRGRCSPSAASRWTRPATRPPWTPRGAAPGRPPRATIGPSQPSAGRRSGAGSSATSGRG